jgi:GH35 family endo-1,4-beta-xylanase
LFGTATSAKSLADSNNTQYRDVVNKYFNSVGFYNDFKWGAMEDGWAPMPRRVKPRSNGSKPMARRFAAMCWCGPVSQLTQPLKELKDKPKELQAEILKHVTETVTTYKDYVSDWDVTNETEGNSDFMNIIGPQAMIEWYKAARTADPKANSLSWNQAYGDHGMEGGSFPTKNCRAIKAGSSIC